MIPATATAAAPPHPAPHVGLRVLCGLIAGRATFRLVLYGANVALLATWGAQTYARYAAVTGALVWLVALAQAGPEKAALKLIPRAGPDRPAMLSALRGAIRFAPFVLLVPALAAIALEDDLRAGSSLYAIGAAQSVALGLNMAAVAVQRALGRTGRELVNFGVLSSAFVAMTALAVVVGLDPVLYVLGLCLATMTMTEITMRGTDVAPDRPSRRAPALRRLAQTAWLMGVYDVAGMAASSIAFVVLPLTGHGEQSGVLYLALVGWGLLLSLLVYVGRVFQPRLSVWLAGEGKFAGRRQARTLARRSLILNVVWLAVVAVVIVAADLRSLPAGTVAIAILTALLLSRGAIWCLMFVSISLLENADLDALRIAARGAALGLVVVAAASIAVIPVFGAAGAVWALATDELALAIVVLRRAR